MRDTLACSGSGPLLRAAGRCCVALRGCPPGAAVRREVGGTKGMRAARNQQCGLALEVGKQ